MSGLFAILLTAGLFVGLGMLWRGREERGCHACALADPVRCRDCPHESKET